MPEIFTPKIERFTLENGLRVLLLPDNSTPVIAVAVVYDVGMRSEPEGRTGFAHLFEHMMFQGSENLEKSAHFKYVQSAGGVFNGSTHYDFTDYYATLPSHALERTLFLEADRMRAPAITEENLANQIDVVKEEIRLNVLNRPYGKFPWLLLPPLMYDTFPNAHDGYGSFTDLDAATVEDATEFFNAYYAPGNAVLAVGGDIDVENATKLIHTHFGDIPARITPSRPSFSEPDLTAERHDTYTDPLAPLPAVALAWRTPNPITEMNEYLVHVLLAEVLTEGDASRLVHRLVRRDGTATHVSAYTSFVGDIFAMRDPTALIVQAIFPPEREHDEVVDAIYAEITRLARDGISADELQRVRTRLTAQLLKGVSAVLPRTLFYTMFEQQHGRAELASQLPELFAQITPEQLQAAASTLVPTRHARLDLKTEEK